MPSTSWILQALFICLPCCAWLPPHHPQWAHPCWPCITHIPAEAIKWQSVSANPMTSWGRAMNEDTKRKQTKHKSTKERDAFNPNIEEKWDWRRRTLRNPLDVVMVLECIKHLPCQHDGRQGVCPLTSAPKSSLMHIQINIATTTSQRHATLNPTFWVMISWWPWFQCLRYLSGPFCTWHSVKRALTLDPFKHCSWLNSAHAIWTELQI